MRKGPFEALMECVTQKIYSYIGTLSQMEEASFAPILT